jgi:anti-sigma regulatory factor (Ser/Thr protein kinase)
MTTTERTLRLPAELMSVRRGRLFARDVMADWDLGPLADDVQLGVSELITNAVRHAGTDVLLRIALDNRLLVEVVDADPDLHHPLTGEGPDAYADSGRGLQIVAAVSSDWGVRSVPEGKVVWFTLELPDATSPDADVYSMSEHRADEVADDGDEESGEAREMRARAVS